MFSKFVLSVSCLALLSIVAGTAAGAQDLPWEYEQTSAYIEEFGTPYWAIAQEMIFVRVDSDPELLDADGIAPDWYSGTAVVIDEDGSMTSMPMVAAYDAHQILVGLSLLADGDDTVIALEGSVCNKPVVYCDTTCKNRVKETKTVKSPKVCKPTMNPKSTCKNRKKKVCTYRDYSDDACKYGILNTSYAIKKPICN